MTASDRMREAKGYSANWRTQESLVNKGRNARKSYKHRVSFGWWGGDGFSSTGGSARG